MKTNKRPKNVPRFPAGAPRAGSTRRNAAAWPDGVQTAATKKNTKRTRDDLRLDLTKRTQGEECPLQPERSSRPDRIRHFAQLDPGKINAKRTREDLRVLEAE